MLNDVLAAMKPRLHLFGHHHEFTDSVRQGVRSIGLDVVTKSYLLVDAGDVQDRAAGYLNLVIWLFGDLVIGLVHAMSMH